MFEYKLPSTFIATKRSFPSRKFDSPRLEPTLTSCILPIPPPRRPTRRPLGGAHPFWTRAIDKDGVRDYPLKRLGFSQSLKSGPKHSAPPPPVHPLPVVRYRISPFYGTSGNRVVAPETTDVTVLVDVSG